MAANQSRALEALGDPTRLLIFQKIAKHEQSVNQVAEGLAVSRPAVSQHLRILKDAGLLDVEQVGTRRVYRVRPEGVDALRRYFEDLWTHNLNAFRTAAERRKNHDDSNRNRTREKAN